MRDNDRKRTTINDIAKLAGVAKSTVSEVINGNRKGRVNPRTEAKILDVIQACRYVPLATARALSSNRTRQLGYLVSSIATLGLANNFFSETLAGVEAACARNDYRCIVGKYDFATPELHDFVFSQKLRQTTVDALILAGNVNDTVRNALATLGIPVTILESEAAPPLFELRCDIVSSTVAALRYLTESGHRHILLPYYGGNRADFRLLQKEVQACRDAGIDFRPIFVEEGDGWNEFEWGGELARRVFEERRYPEATVIYTNDQVAIGFLRRMHRYGRRCPEEFSILSSCDSLLCEFSEPRLSALRLGCYDYGALAAEEMIALTEERKSAADVRETFRREFHPRELIRRDSCAAPRRTPAS